MVAPARGALVVFGLAMLVSLGIANASPSRNGNDGSACISFPDAVPGLGPSRLLPSGLREVCAPDGTLVLTHGFDVFPPGGGGTSYFQGVTAQPPHCVADPATEYHHRIIYARPFDTADQYASRLGTIRTMFQTVNGKMRQEAAEFGVTANYKTRCVGGQIDVANAALPTSSTDPNEGFTRILVDLHALGFNKDNEKYIVMYDDAVPCPGGGGGCYGLGGVGGFDERSLGNGNNYGDTWGVNFNCYTSDYCTMVMMHENGHTWGAVQDSAPDSSGAAHCNDGKDIMCYADGGSTSNYNPNVCTDRYHFDCDHDSYFHPGTPTGYLATRWNIGWRYDRFLQFGDVNQAPGSAPQNLVARDGKILRVSVVSSAQGINLTWSPPTDVGSGFLTDYVIHRTDPGQPERILAWARGDRTYFVDTDFQPDGTLSTRTYSYRVSALNNAGEGPLSALASATLTYVKA